MCKALADAAVRRTRAGPVRTSQPFARTTGITARA
jgi:hypothetical protein